MERQKQLGSTMRYYSEASPSRVMDVEVPKQDMVGRGVRNRDRNKGKSFMGVK